MTMVKATKNYHISSTQKNGNRKLTDFFLRSSNEPPSSQSQPSQSQARLSTTKYSTSASKGDSTKFTPVVTSSPIRGPKKENEPPRMDQEIISISSRSDSATHITISSDSSVISISSSFSSPAPVPIAIIDTSAEANANHLSPLGRSASTSIELMSQSPPPRRSPRLQSTFDNKSKQKIVGSYKICTQKKPTPHSSSVQTAVDVPYKGTKRKAPLEEELFSSSGTVTSNNKPIIKGEHVAENRASMVSRSQIKTAPLLKKAKLERSDFMESDIQKIIPSSQSDETEFSFLQHDCKDQNEIRENVEAWKKNSLDSRSSLNESWKYTYDSRGDVDTDTDIIMTADVGDFKAESIIQEDACLACPVENVAEVSMIVLGAQINCPATPATPATLSSSLSPLSRSLTPLPEDRLSMSQSLLSTPIETPKRTLPTSTSPRLSSSASSSTRVSVSVPNKLPVMPKALDEKTKTQLIIDEIKRKAFAAASSSPGEDERGYGELKELSSSSDSEDEIKLDYKPMFCKVDKGKGKSSDVNLISNHGTSTAIEKSEFIEGPSVTRRSQRSVPSKSSSCESSFKLTNRGAKGAPNQRKKDVDPFDALLKEKARDEALGISSLTLLQDEANKAALEFANQLGMGSSPSASGSSDDGDLNNVIGESERTRLLGSPGRAIDRIIKSDQLQSARAAVEDGVEFPIWKCEEGMENKSHDGVPHLLDESRYFIIEMLRKYAVSNDVIGINSILQSGLLTTAIPPLSEHLISWLFSLVVLDYSFLGDSAYRSLLRRNTSGANKMASFSFGIFQNAMLRLGMRTDVMELLDLQICAHTHVTLKPKERSAILFRLVAIIESFARARQLKTDDLSHFVAILLCIAIDPDTEMSLRNDIVYTIETLCTVFIPVTPSRNVEEMKLCRTILKLRGILRPESRALLLSCLTGGSVVGLRVAQWVAYGLLTEGRVDDDDFAVAPPLSTIISMLTPGTRDELGSGIFEIRRENGTDETDYSALASHVEILGTMLRNVAVYVKFEKEERKTIGSSQSDASTSYGVTSPPSTPSRKSAQAPKSYLETLHQLLDKLSNSIVDTRAAHPERSKVKAALQHLVHRVHYERQSILKSSGGKSQNLEKWMKKKQRPVQRRDSST